jgi:OmpA-OmpF porin, OOP family
MQKPLITSIALIASALTTHAGQDYSKRIQEPATQAMGHFYWSVLGGVNIQQTADIEDVNTSIGTFDREYDSDTGWFAALKFGYEFESESPVHAALELEALYTQVEGNVRSTSGIFDAQSEGDIHGAALMLNALVKFKPVWKLRPYLGAGVGIGYVERDDVSTTVRVGATRVATGNQEGGDGYTFAYQGIAGFDWWVTDRWTIYTEYKAFVFDDAAGLENYLNHMAGVGIRVKF